MSEKPILFSGPMIRAILEGRKTMTRRVIVPQPTAFRFGRPVKGDGESVRELKCPYGQPGDRLWVRETWSRDPSGDSVFYRAGSPGYAGSWITGTPVDAWRPSIFMPRALSRILLEMTAVRVERVQDISEEDAKAEGSPWEDCWMSYRQSFEALWNSINASRGYGWDANPWVRAIEFKVLAANSK
jgi:hypothetical protein